MKKSLAESVAAVGQVPASEPAIEAGPAKSVFHRNSTAAAIQSASHFLRHTLTNRVLSVTVGQPREVVADDRVVRTSIFKSPVTGRVPIRNNNLAGDRQSDLSVHGGRAKAVYAYPHEHYAFWREQLPGVDLQPGHFGENLTIEGLLEEDVHLGDRVKIGSAELLVTQPRLPCYKLGIRFGRADMVKRFLASGRTGFYLAVAAEGDVAAGDTIEILERHPAAISIPELLGMYLQEDVAPGRLREAIAIPALSEAWRSNLCKQLPEGADFVN